jgi:PKD repeat protein
MKATSCFKSYIAKSLLCSILLLSSIQAFSQPAARFSAALSTGCAPILVNFTDESTGSPNYWRWDLGNGTISYLQNPSVTYFNPGTYTIKLLVKNAAGQDSIIQTGFINVYAAPVVDFSSSQTSGCNTVSANFSNLGNSANNWQWDFGDGVFSSEPNPSHTYLQTGSYNVSLKAVNEHGCSLTIVKPAYINVNMVEAGFDYTVSNRCQPARLSFQNNSAGNGRLTYKWFFGNGDSSVQRTPVYTYSSGGTYSVKLIVSNEFGCEDIANSSITVDNPVSAAFTANITNSCKAPVAIQFTNQVLSNNNYSWSFGDTAFSPASNPVHVYKDAGSYTVKLVVRNSNGCSDSLIKINYINIQKSLVSFDNLPDSGCSGFNKRITFSSAGLDSITNYLWSFGDGGTSTQASPSHIFSGDRYFAISLITTGVSGCRDTTVMQHAIHTGNKPIADFSANSLVSCAQTRIEFTDQTQGIVTQWQWNFGDNGQMFEQNPAYRFSDTGFLAVELIAFNGGCSDTATKFRYQAFGF